MSKITARTDTVVAVSCADGRVLESVVSTTTAVSYRPPTVLAGVAHRSAVLDVLAPGQPFSLRTGGALVPILHCTVRALLPAADHMIVFGDVEALRPRHNRWAGVCASPAPLHVSGRPL